MLTDSKIKSAVKTATKEVTLSDNTGVRGDGRLRLRIRPTVAGVTAVWLGYRKTNGERSTRVIGRYPEMSLKDAREAFANTDMATGGQKPDKPTLERLFGGYIESMRQNGRVSASEVSHQLDLAAAALGKDKAAGDITADDVARYLATIYDRGSRVMADRMRAYISAAFNWGILATNDYRIAQRQDWGIVINPAAAVKRDAGANVPRERNLSDGELRALWADLCSGDGFEYETAAAIKLLVLTGQRVRETLRVEGVDIDQARNVWGMPARKTKTRKAPHVLPLSKTSADVFNGLIQLNGDGPLFNGLLDTSLNRALRRWSRKNGLQDFQTRDLRRTWKSRASDAGIDRFTRDLIQQHAQGDTGSKHYDKADYMPQMRAAMDKWDLWLRRNITGSIKLADLRVV